MSSRPTGELQWITRGRRKILQQQWFVYSENHPGTGGYEWRDVPIAREPAKRKPLAAKESING